MLEFSKPHRLIWEYEGELRVKHFASFANLEAFSRKLIKAGLLPMVPSQDATPYDLN